MSSGAGKVAGYGQGSKTATVLTNRSNFIMIVTDEPETARHPDTFEGLPTIRKGVRPMNKSTLSLGSSPEKTSYESCMKSSFSGSKSLPSSKRPSRYPSQHTSQFSIGANSEHSMASHSRTTYVNHSKAQTKQHEHNERWNNQMSGKDMVESTQQGSNINFNSTYEVVHNKLGKERGPGTKVPPSRRPCYNILTGAEVHTGTQEEFHKTSGNRTLSHTRESQKEPFLQ